MSGVTSCRAPLRRALEQLAPHCTDDRVDAVVSLVDEAMSGPMRHYHNLSHALMVADSDDPLEVVIGLFHDIVQMHVEQGLPSISASYLRNILDFDFQHGFRFINKGSPASDLRIRIVKSCFELNDTDALIPTAGRNEFLSALIASEAIGDLINAETLIALSVGIEATIPFRKHRSTEKEFYFKKIKLVADQFGIDISDKDALQHAQRAIRLANRDVRSFGENNLRAFLDETWDLMFESLPQLSSGLPTDISNYRNALQKMTRFLSSLTADMIFQQEDHQSDAVFAEQLANTARNLEIIAHTMQTKLLATLLIELERKPESTHFKPIRRRIAASPDEQAMQKSVISLLSAGATAKIEFDVSQSPLSCCIAKALTAEEVRFYMAQLDTDSGLATNLLEELPSEVRAKAREIARKMLI